MADLVDFEATAVALARAAGAQALEAFQSTLELEFKGRKKDNPVTALDRDLETFLRTELRAAYPSHGLLGEEHADDIQADSEFVWVLDPIDGTANFASGLPLWGISIGLLQRGVPVAGCIWVPSGPRLGPGAFHARQGGGAWFDETPIRTLALDDERGRLMTVPGDAGRVFRIQRPDPKLAHQQRVLPDVRTLGSCTAELVLIASGALRAGVFVRPSIWDVAAGVLIAREAGCTVLTWHERRWQPFAAFAAMAPPGKKGAPALRHWGQPVLLGAPDAITRLLERMTWHPRLSARLRKLVGVERGDEIVQGRLALE